MVIPGAVSNVRSKINLPSACSGKGSERSNQPAPFPGQLAIPGCRALTEAQLEDAGAGLEGGPRPRPAVPQQPVAPAGRAPRRSPGPAPAPPGSSPPAPRRTSPLPAPSPDPSAARDRLDRPAGGHPASGHGRGGPPRQRHGQRQAERHRQYPERSGCCGHSRLAARQPASSCVSLICWKRGTKLE